MSSLLSIVFVKVNHPHSIFRITCLLEIKNIPLRFSDVRRSVHSWPIKTLSQLKQKFQFEVLK